jgi:hypothetical protein
VLRRGIAKGKQHVCANSFFTSQYTHASEKCSTVGLPDEVSNDSHSNGKNASSM